MLQESKTTEFKREYTDDLKYAVVAFANTDGGKIYIGINDENYLNSELFRHAELSFVKTVEETVTDNTGTEYSGCSGGSNRDNNMLTQMN